MKILKFGQSSEEVLSWKTFLRGFFSCDLELSDSFDQETLDLTKRFQSYYSLTSDGVVGPKTFAQALKEGFPLKDDDAVSSVKMLTGKQKEDLLGNFTYTSSPVVNNPEGITIGGTWVSDNISLFYIPQLIGIPGAPKSGNVYFHNAAGPSFQKLFQKWEDDGLMKFVLSWGGSFMPRFVRGSRTYLSNHAYGTAFDINSIYNPLGSTPVPEGTKGSVKPLLAACEELGIFWGGNFDRPDGMHFELGIL